jgi:hypothetical protein
MSHPGSAPCPKGFAPGQGGPSSIVVVEIVSVKPNTDLEGDDDFVPFYDNHADIYGFVTIDGETFEGKRVQRFVNLGLAPVESAYLGVVWPEPHGD